MVNREKVMPDVGKLPVVVAWRFCPARLPARYRAKTMGKKRPNSMAKPNVICHQGSVTVRPAKAEPLLLAAEVNA